MASLILLMGIVCLAPILASLAFVAFAPRAHAHRGILGGLGALFGFLLGLIAVFCGVMLPLSSLGLSGQPGKGAESLLDTVGISAGVGALAASLLSYIVTRQMARAMAKRA